MRTAAALGLAACVLAAPRPARAGSETDVKTECVNASTQGQSLRDAAKLVEAREQFVACARDACPAIVRKACADWLADADKRLPTIVFRAQGPDGNDATDARVSLDGKALAHGLDGAAIPIDPGEHDVRFERDGAQPVNERVVVVEGEKRRVVTARFAGTGATPPAASGATGAETPAEAPPPRRLTPLVVVLAGVGVAGLGTFAGFGIAATNDLNHLRQTCAPYCTPSQLGSVKAEAAVADISLGVGVVSLAAATFAFFWRGSVSTSAPAESAVTFDVRPERGGAYGVIGARF